MLGRGTIKIWQDKNRRQFLDTYALQHISKIVFFFFLVEGGTRTISPVLHSGQQHAKYSPCQDDRTSVYLRVALMLNTADTTDISRVI